MATTPKGIYYPNNYNEIADIPGDMKKMAESIEEVFENTDSDLSDIKEEQTTQNNRLNSLEVDNTTNKSDILTNKQEINNIKTEQTEQNTNISTNATNIESLQEENENLKKIVSQLPQVTGQGTSITLENTIEAPFTKFDVEGNSTQESTKGYQLLPKVTKLNETIRDIFTTGGITYTNLGGGHFHISGTATETTSCAIFRDTAEPLFVPAGSYTISSNNLPDGVKIITSGGGNNGFVYTELSSSNPKVTSSVTDDTKPFNYIMLESGTTAHEWEPYTNGASPSPNYEQPIYSAGENIQLFDKTTVVTNKYINNQGEEVAGAGFDASDFISVNPNTNIVLSGNNFIQSTHGAKGAFYNINKEFVSYVNIAIGNNVYAVPNTARYFRFSLKPNDLDIIKVEKGSIATPWSPYGMGFINEKISNKNYLPNNVVNQTKNGVTLVKNNDGTITANGTATAQTEILISSVKLSAGNYLGSIGVTGSVSTYYARLGEGTTSQSPFIANIGTGDNAFSLTESKTIGAVLIIRSGQTLNNVIFKPMIRLASITDNSYVPHKEQDYPIFVQQPMRSIGDVRDLFFKNTKDSEYYDENLTLNGWYERHYIKYLELLISAMNNSENYPGWTNVQQIKNDFPNINTQLITKTSFLCNIFEKTSRIMVINTVGNNSILYLDKSLLNLTQTQWKENYPNLVLKLGYISPEPLDLPCTETQIQQLENKPSTYKDFTIIQSEDETPAYLEVAGIYDLNKLITRTEVLESEV